MKYYQLNGEINNELLDKFIDFINENEKGEVSVIIDSTGGKTNLTYFIIHFINENKERITLINSGCYSSAFVLLYKAKCKRVLLTTSIGMIHMAYIRDISIDAKGNTVFSDDKCQLKNIKSHDIDFVKEFMTKAELRKYNAGKDVFFTFERMKEIFPDAEIQ